MMRVWLCLACRYIVGLIPRLRLLGHNYPVHFYPLSENIFVAYASLEFCFLNSVAPQYPLPKRCGDMLRSALLISQVSFSG